MPSIRKRFATLVALNFKQCEVRYVGVKCVYDVDHCGPHAGCDANGNTYYWEPGKVRVITREDWSQDE